MSGLYQRGCFVTGAAAEDDMKLMVLMQNDYPIGTYSSEDTARAAADKHYERRYKGMNVNLTQADYHYRTYEFTVDAESK